MNNGTYIPFANKEEQELLNKKTSSEAEIMREKYKQALIEKKKAELCLSMGTHGHFTSMYSEQMVMNKIEAEAELETIEMEWKLQGKEEL